MKFAARTAGLLAASFVLTVGLAAAQTGPMPNNQPPPPAVDELPVPAPPVPQARAWILLDAASGNILAGENYDTPLEPASITKVMTSYVVAAELKAGKVKRDDPVMMSENAWRKGGAGTEGSYSGFEVNKTAPLIEMEKGMVVQSGNDAAIALAEHIAGSEDAFASLMNAYAKRIGLTHSHWVNPDGLPADGHLTTAHDLALLGRALIRDYPESYALNKIKEYRVGPITQMNRNRLLWRDPSVDGIKTGHTETAGFCLMASAQRADQRLISVVMGEPSEPKRVDDSQALLNWGFRFFETHRLYEAGKQVAVQKLWKGEQNEVRLGLAEPLMVTLPRGRYGKLKPVMNVPQSLVAPIAKGQKIGTVKVMLDGKVLSERPLVALDAVAEAGFFKKLWHDLLMWWAST